MDKKQFSILIVDDEEDIRDVLEIALKDIGYKVFLAEDGKKAFEIFTQEMPAIVITDIKMPVMGGIELLKQVKLECPDTEVLMITGHGDMALTISSLKFGAMDFITKPINVDILELAVAKAVDKLLAKQKLLEYTQKLELLLLEKSKLTSHLSSLGLMIGTISHNIKGLLTNLDGGLYLARSSIKKNDPDAMDQGLDILTQSVDRIKKMILDILLYSKERKMQKKSVSIKGFLEDIQDAMAMKLKNSSVQFTIMSNPALDRIDLDPVFMMSALINILDNAIDACQGDETKEHHFIRFDLGQEKEILVMKIQDNGCGMDMETREKIFELFFSSKRNQGTGFGLFIAHSIITQHGGTIAVESLKRKGTTFTISLPLPEPGPNLDRQEQSKQGL